MTGRQVASGNNVPVRAQIHPKIDTSFLLAPLTGVAAQPSGVVLNFDEVCGGIGVSVSATKLENAIGSAVAAVTGVRCRTGFLRFTSLLPVAI
jgi:hypothetical protein